MLDEVYHSTDDPLPILRSGTLLTSPSYGGVSFSTNKGLKAHGSFKLVFRNASWFKKLKQLLYLKPVMRGLGRVDHYTDQANRVYTVDEFEQIPIKNRRTIHSGKQLRGNLQFANEQEWYSVDAIKFNPKDVAEVVVMQDASDTEQVVDQLEREFPHISIRRTVEAEYGGPLYHLIGPKQLQYIAEHNELKCNNFWNGISTTRSKNLNSYVGGPVHIPFKLELDGAKISKDYETSPFVYKSRTKVRFTGEKEELIHTTQIPDIWKYVTRLIFIAENIERNFEYYKYWGLKDIQDKYLPGIAAKDIPFYVQHGTEIVKDDTFLEKYGFLKPPTTKKRSKTKTTAELFKSITIKDKTGKARELEIYANPRKYEIREILKYTEYPKDVTPYVNFFIDFRHKAVYVWNGEYATHADVAPLIPLDMHHEETVSGIAEILYPEYKLNPLALYQGKRDLKQFEWEWLDTYLRRISTEYNLIAKGRIRANLLSEMLHKKGKIKLAKRVARLHAKIYYTPKGDRQ